MKIGIVGSEGIVGSACKFGFELVGHEVKCHDLKLGTKLEDIMDTELVFICVPTPMNDDGSCNTSIVEDVVKKMTEHLETLKAKNVPYSFPIICIKSTIPIGTTSRLYSTYGYLRPEFKIAFCPEFLKERSAIIDFTERHDLCVIGTYGLYTDDVFEKIKRAHGDLPKKVVRTTATNAEAIKYFNNAFGAMLVVFANSFYEVCKANGANYKEVKKAIAGNRPHIPNEYLEVNDKWRGYSSICWNKDIPALVKMCEGTNVEFFQKIIDENEKYMKTPAPNTREDYEK